MSNHPLTGTARVSFKCSDELADMLEAAAGVEHRNTSDICRIALHEYFAAKGYYDPENLLRMAAGLRANNNTEENDG